MFRSRRTQITLGKITRQQAEYTAAMINMLIEVQKSQTSLGPELETWLQAVPDQLAEKLSDAGIIQNQHRRLTFEQLFAEFLAYYEGLNKVQESTKSRMRVSLNRLPEFAKDIRIRESNSELMDRIDNYVVGNWAMATAGRTHGDMIQVGNWAVRRGFTKRNPFQGLPRYEAVNEETEQYIDERVVRQVIAVTGCSDLRTIFALARFAGLRVISELVQLTWKDSYRPDDNCLIVRKSKKRKDRPNKNLFKIIPLWPFLDKVLVEQWELTGSRSTHIITTDTLRATDTAIRQRGQRAARRANLTPWPKFWQNLRYSYANDVRKVFDVETGAALTGHSPEVALQNYRRRKIDVQGAMKSGLFGI